MGEIIIIAALAGLAGLLDGVKDSLQFHFSSSFARNWNAEYWNPSKSWRRKYKNGDPNNGPAFFGSTTFLVFLTDAWHLSKFLKAAALRLAVVVLLPFAWYYLVAAYFALWGIQAAGFHLIYTLFDNNQ